MVTAPVVAEIVRSGFVEGHHYGSIVALGESGEVDWAVGDADQPILPRSCNKPIQALAMVRLGLKLPPELLALACASHSGEDFHLEGVRRILEMAGLDESDLQTPAGYPLDDEARESLLRNGGGPAPIHMNCSGKHAAMLATCRVNGWETKTYRSADHPLQAATRETFAELIGEPVDTVAVDGCGAPLFPASLVGLARAFRRLALGLDGSDRPDPQAVEVAEAIRAHPEYVSGTRRDEVALLRAIPGAIGKAGAESCYAARAGRRSRHRAQDRRRRPPGPAGADGRGAAPQRDRRRKPAWTPRPYVVPARLPCSVEASRWARSGPASEVPEATVPRLAAGV